MAGSLDGRARRVRRLEGRGLERPAPSQTELEAHALDAEIREVDEELEALGVEPNGWGHATNDSAHMTLDEHIAALEKEIHDDDDH
jgi:hypothetical protein